MYAKINFLINLFAKNIDIFSKSNCKEKFYTIKVFGSNVAITFYKNEDDARRLSYSRKFYYYLDDKENITYSRALL